MKNFIISISLVLIICIAYVVLKNKKEAIDPDKLNEERRNWREENEPYGLSLGYPKCCVDEFCDLPPYLMQRRNVTDEDKLKYAMAHVDGNYTGFIPCIKHAKQIQKGEIKLSDLIQNRDAKHPPFLSQI